MTKPNDQAFPVFVDCGPGDRGVNEGMTKRELFSALAMNGLLSALVEWSPNVLIDEDQIADDAVAVADSLIERLNAKSKSD